MSDTTTTAPDASAAPTTHRKERTAEVISISGHKSIVVRSVSRVPHPKFLKIVKRTKKYHVHDEECVAQIGDTVRIVETRPLSRLKRWRLVEIIRH